MQNYHGGLVHIGKALINMGDMGEHCPLIFNKAEFDEILIQSVCVFCLLLCFEDMTRVTHLHL